MTSGTFPLLADFLFLLAALITPAISCLLLRKKLRVQPEAAREKAVSSLIVGPILVWTAAVLVLGFAMVTLVGAFVYVNAHAGARGNEPLSPLPMMVAAGLIVVLIMVGWALHVLTWKKLRRP